MKAFVTITGLKYHFGSKPFVVGQKIRHRTMTLTARPSVPSCRGLAALGM